MLRSGCLPLAIFVGVAVSTSAVAADLPMYVKARPIAPFAPWTGFYAGPHFGFGWGSKQFLAADGTLDADASVNGGLGGLQAGYNHQFNWLVVGAEGDFSWSGVHGDFSCFRFGDQVCSAKPEWLASLAGRLGVAYGPGLFYVKGGAAWAQDHYSAFATCAGNQPRTQGGITADCGNTFFGDQYRSGWLFGVGIEYMFAPNWSAKLEYNYMDFGTRSVQFRDEDTNFLSENIRQKMNVLKVGVNYHFDWGTGRAAPIKGASYGAAKEPEDEEEARVLPFSGFDASKRSYGGWVGAHIAPYKDLDTSGLRFYMFADSGAYRYPSGDKLISGVFETGDALAGYAFEGDFYSINLLAGLNAANHTLSDVDTENKVQGTAFGAKVRGDAWINPTPKTLLFAEGEYSTAFQTFFTKGKFGYDFTNGKEVFFGPEVAFFGDERSNQWRVGAHVTQIKIGKFHLDVSGGYANDSINGPSAYGTIELNTQF
jgi:outer membrane immunogenic protein